MAKSAFNHDSEPMPDFDDDGFNDSSVFHKNEQTVRKGFWQKLIETLSHIPFAEEVVAAYYCAFDNSTPLKVRGILLAALAYFIMPFDVVPDFIFGLGFTDDITVLATAFGLIRSHIKPEHRTKAQDIVGKLRRGDPIDETDKS